MSGPSSLGRRDDEALVLDGNAHAGSWRKTESSRPLVGMRSAQGRRVDGMVKTALMQMA